MPAVAAGRCETSVDILPIAPLVARIVAHLRPEEIWLFGSRAEGRARPDSDYDLLAVLPDDAPESALDLLKAWELTCGLGIPAGPRKRGQVQFVRSTLRAVPAN